MITLSFEIPPALYKRAVTYPLVERPSRAKMMARNVVAAVLFPASLAMLGFSFFGSQGMAPFLLGAGIGACFVLAVWWRQHFTLVRLHKTYNDTGGQQEMALGPDGITAARPFIQSRIDWPFVRAIRGIDGATLIELPTARLIVPDAALSEVSPAQFRDQLETWRRAG